MYNYGSAAKKIERTASFDAKEVKLAKPNKKTAAYEAQVAAIKKYAIKSLVAITVLLTVVMVREARIDQLCGQVTKVETEIAELNSLIMEKEMHLSYQLDMNNIDEVAVSRLGMKKPDASQYVYINVDKNSGGEVLVDQGDGNGFSAFVNKAKILLEYLY